MYKDLPHGKVAITLTDTEYQALLVVLGYALGAAVKDGESQLADHMLKLANTINEGNPKWHRYATKEDPLNQVQ